MLKLDSAGGVIINKLSEVVVVFTNTNSWQFPKGTVEKGESFFDTALREIKEETGLTGLKQIKQLPSYSRISTHEKNTIRNIHYFLFTTVKKHLKPNAEISKCRWVPFGKVENLLTYPEDKEFIISQKAGIYKALNKPKFDLVRQLNLPISHYAITSSGPLGIRGIRLINDIDIVVDDKLWAVLEDEYGKITEGVITKISLSKRQIEILGKGSFWNNYKPEDPSINQQIEQAELIEGLPFVKLEYVLYFKRQLGRDKDLEDVTLINRYLKN